MRIFIIRLLLQKSWFWMFLLFCGLGCFFDAPNLRGWNCEKDSDCLEKLSCHQQKCVAPCSDNNECLGGESCSNNFCVSTQNPDSGVCKNPQPEKCNNLDDDCDGKADNGIVCVQEGKICDPYAKTPVLCTKDFSCITFSPSRPRVCLRKCNKGNPCKDKQFSCTRAINNAEVCLQNVCTLGSNDCIYQEHECVSIGGNTLCYGIHPKGTKTFGQVCKPSAKGTSIQGKFCTTNLQCMRREEETNGFCTVKCQKENDCKNVTPAGSQVVCKLIFSENIKACQLKCTKQDECPLEMKCNEGLQLCRFQKK